MVRVTSDTREPYENLQSEFVMASDYWRDNGELIADVARVGYLKKEWKTCDPTYGLGTFWKDWRPDVLIASDLDPAKSPCGKSLDATDLPYSDRSFMSVVIDGPYKLNGTPDEIVDSRYGTQIPTRWQDRIELLLMMLDEGARLLADGGYLLFKCQDQVCSGKVRWQTRLVTDRAEKWGFGLVDRFNKLGDRAQPLGTRQVHARQNCSSLLVFQRGW